MKGYQLKISIKGAKPPVWRRIIIPANSSFHYLHEAIQELFGWMNYHLYNFYIPSLKLYIEDQNEEDDFNFFSHTSLPMNTKLEKLLDKGIRLVYTYDYGDNWQHQILVEDVVNMDANYPILLKWKGDNFAEDTGNVYGYNEIMKIIQDTNHPENQSFKDWMEMQHIDFDEDCVQAALENLKAHDMFENELSMEQSRSLNNAVNELIDVLNQKECDDTAVIALEQKDGSSKIAAINFSGVDYSIEIFENETDFSISLDYASCNGGYNFYTNAYNIVIHEHGLPSFHGWINDQHNCIVRKLRTGYLPLDINNEEAEIVIDDIYDIISVLEIYQERKLPSYPDDQIIKGRKAGNTFDVSLEEASFYVDKVSIRLLSEQKKELLETPVFDQDVKIDLIAIPDTENADEKRMYIILLMEGEEEILIDESLDPSALSSFTEMNEEVANILCSFILEKGRMKSITVNHENMYFMLSGICDSLSIPLYRNDFITEVEREFHELLMDKDIEYLQKLANLSEEEFYQMMDNMSEDEFYEFQHYISQFISEEDDIFDEMDDDIFEDEPAKRHFDA